MHFKMHALFKSKVFCVVFRVDSMCLLVDRGILRVIYMCAWMQACYSDLKFFVLVISISHVVLKSCRLCMCYFHSGIKTRPTNADFFQNNSKIKAN